MRISLLLAICSGVAFISIATATHSETITIAGSVPYASKTGITSEQKAQCALDTRLPGYIEAAAASAVEIVISREPLSGVTGQTLELEITSVFDHKAGIVYRQPAVVAVRGSLRKNGEETASFIAMRRTKKTAKFDGFKGSCARLGRNLESLSRDIVIWLLDPTMDAKLGDV